MGKRFDLTKLAQEESFVPPAFQSIDPSPAASTQVSDDVTDDGYRHLRVESIALNPLNERPSGDDAEIEGLAQTLRDYGVIQPLLVCSIASFRQRYPAEGAAVDGAEWIALIGNRRLRAARRAQLATVPVIVNDETLASMYRAMLIENLQHQAMPPLHEAEAMAKAMKEESVSQRELAAQIGKTQGFISQRLALLKLIPELREALNRGDMSVEVARTLGELPSSDQRAIAAAGKPYKRPTAPAEAASQRRGWAASPAKAANAITQKFTDPEELAELIALLSDQLTSLQRPRT